MTGAAKERELLERFGLVSEQQVADLLGVTVKSLKNRPADRLPAYFKSGRRRLFIEASVRDFLGLPSAPVIESSFPSLDSELDKAIGEAAHAAAKLSDKLLNIQAVLRRSDSWASKASEI
jgi:hypothetical protein